MWYALIFISSIWCVLKNCKNWFKIIAKVRKLTSSGLWWLLLHICQLCLYFIQIFKILYFISFKYYNFLHMNNYITLNRKEIFILPIQLLSLLYWYCLIFNTIEYQSYLTLSVSEQIIWSLLIFVNTVSSQYLWVWVFSSHVFVVFPLFARQTYFLFISDQR